MLHIESAITPAQAPPNRFALSVDVEDYFQVWAFSDVIRRDRWDDFELRVGDATRACLDMLDRHETKATFFTLGWVAERDPRLVREIVSRGHELASHGYDHTKVNQQTHVEFYADVIRAKSVLEDIAGVAVRGYRAPGFSIDTTTPWAHEMLVAAGYRYSSSSHPISHDHYGDVNAPQDVFAPINGADFVEAPVATVKVFGKRVSCAGGGWYRATPVALSKMFLKRVEKNGDGPIIFYFHPWEIDEDQPRIRNASFKSKIRHYLNISGMGRKLDSVLSAFSWGRIDTALGICVEERHP